MRNIDVSFMWIKSEFLMGDNMRPIEKHNLISDVVRYMMDISKTSQEEICKAFGYNIGTFRNKLSNGNFTIKQLSDIAYICGGDLLIKFDDEEIKICEK